MNMKAVWQAVALNIVWGTVIGNLLRVIFG